MNVSLEDLRALSDSLASLPDDRPAWVRAMPYVTETPSHYSKLLFEIVRRYKPEVVIEIGIDKAGSTMSLAAGNPGSQITSIDIDRASCENAGRIAAQQGLKNLTVLHDSSTRRAPMLVKSGMKADLLFIDGAHDFFHCYRDYEVFRPLMNQGGIILFDDIHQGREMEVAWSYVVDPKIELPRSHHSGFGACKVNHAVVCPSFDDIQEEAKRKYS